LSINQVTVITYLATGNPTYQQTNLGSLRVAQVESPGLEMARSGRSFVGGTSVVAGGQASVVDMPTTTAPWILFNSSASGAGNRHLVIKRLTAFFASGTMPATGFGIFGGVTISKLATPLTATGASHRTQATRGSATALGFIDVAKTIPAGTAWLHLGGTLPLTNTTTIGPCLTVELTAPAFIVQPLFAFSFGVLGDTAGSPLYGMSIAWDEVEMSLP
jgi:hypothetical protein